MPYKNNIYSTQIEYGDSIFVDFVAFGKENMHGRWTVFMKMMLKRLKHLRYTVNTRDVNMHVLYHVPGVFWIHLDSCALFCF